MPHSREDFVGAWSLIDWRIEYDDGAVTRPFGEDAHGYIVYSANGIMTASIARGNRQKFGLANARKAGSPQKSEAFDSYFHYAGPWHIDDEHVVHDVTLSINPDMTGTKQRRLAQFDGRRGLILSAGEPIEHGGARHHILEWQRVSKI